MADNKVIICCKCKKELVKAKVYFNYLGHSFFTDIHKCPECGEVYIPEELVKGRMSEVELQLEDK